MPLCGEMLILGNSPVHLFCGLAQYVVPVFESTFRGCRTAAVKIPKHDPIPQFFVEACIRLVCCGSAADFCANSSHYASWAGTLRLASYSAVPRLLVYAAGHKCVLHAASLAR